MEAILLVVHVLLALSLIGLVLLQHGKGAEVGASFGSGASSTVFGSSGSASFLTRLTTIIAIVFFASSLALAYLSTQSTSEPSLVDNLAVEEPVELPAVPEGASSSIEQAEPAKKAESAKNDEQASPASTDKPVPADVPAIEE